ncbi:MAG: hypothetical protein OEW82_04445 [Dehalococcoidia bacterium]|nr:hypothetical protein [Dehalococcoidia bacterium]
MSKERDTEAIKIYILREKKGSWTYRVIPPASLKDRVKELSFYGEHGLWLKTEGQLLLWIEEVAKLKLQNRAKR